jgi:hypothetical protein
MDVGVTFAEKMSGESVLDNIIVPDDQNPGLLFHHLLL